MDDDEISAGSAPTHSNTDRPSGGVPRLAREPFGTLEDGRPVERIRLRGAHGFEAAIITCGAAVQALLVPDRHGLAEDVVLGHDSLAAYVARRRFFGATVGRYANRIAAGRFSLDGRPYELACNNGPNSLHGGLDGFDRRLWRVEAAGAEPEPFVTLALTSPDGDQGFPGRLEVRLTYRVRGGHTLDLAFEARTDAPTVVNLTHHGFFNLRGANRPGDILDHEVLIPAETYLPVDPTGIPEGGPAPVGGTPFDFRAPHRVGERIRRADTQLQRVKGYDHTYCLGTERAEAPRLAARLSEPLSGRVLEVLTDQPGLQLYTGNNIDGSDCGKAGWLYRQSDAICLEPHLWPDSPNRPDFPSPRLDRGEVYRHHTQYRFPNLG